jgi:F-type H+-transporting ATPase subunit epsilon
MQTNTIHFELTTASQGAIWDRNIVETILPTTTGFVGVLPGHTGMITTIEPGLLRIKEDKVWIPILVFGGTAMIKNNELLVAVSGVEFIGKEYGNLEDAKKVYEEAKAHAATVLADESTSKAERSKAIQATKLGVSRVAAYNLLQQQEKLV